MGVYGDQVLPRALDLWMRGADVREIRARVAAGMTGEVLEIGFGSGLNVPHYPAGVTRVAGRGSGRRWASVSPPRGSPPHAVPVEFIGTDAQALPAAGSSADFVLSTWTLCTIPDPARALAEAYRVLRPGGEPCASSSTGSRPTRGWPACSTGSPRCTGGSSAAVTWTARSRT